MIIASTAIQHREWYQHILGLKSPWTVSQVSLSLSQQQIDVFVEHPTGTKLCCPDCGQTLPCYDLTTERQWRYLDSCQFKMILHGSIPRIEYPTRGVKKLNVSWAEKCSRFIILFDCFAIDVLLATQNVKGAMGLLQTVRSAADTVIHSRLKPMKAVARSIKERLANLVSYCTHRITNGVAEDMNSKIMSIKRRVGGFRNRNNFKTAIFCYCGELNLYSQ